MSNEQPDPSISSPITDQTKTHGTDHPLTDGTRTHPGISSSITANWNPKADHSIPGYQILEKLGRGGMGVVHLARDLHADRLVALKRIMGDSIRESDLIRFRIEAQAIARLRHPQIIPIFHVGEHDGKPYFTMEYCLGGSLAQLLDHKPQPALLCAQITETIAKAIHHAHESGIVHRDLKPNNILIASRIILPGESSSGSSKEAPSINSSQVPRPFSAELLRITDFGLAKKLDSESQLTQTQNILGTPNYMAPEQATSTKQAGPQADIWAIGVILYEMITGSLPFVGADAVEIIDNLRTKDPVAPSKKVKVPKDLETICLKCLRKDPLDRYPSAQTLVDDLRAFQEGRSISARPMSKLEKGIRWVGRNPVPTALVSITVISLILGTIISLIYADKADHLAKVEKERSEQLKGALLKAQSAEESEKERAEELQTALEDAEHLNANANLLLAHSATNTELGNDFLHRIPPNHRQWDWHFLNKQLQGGLFPLYGHTGPVYSVSCSPDGSQIASSSADSTIRIWNAKTGQKIRTLKGHISSIFCVCWSPDASQIASGSADKTVRIWDAKTGQVKRTLRGHTEKVRSVCWSPDSSQIVSGGGEFPRSGEIRIWDAKTGQSKLDLQGHSDIVSSVSWSPDGSQIASGSFDMSVRIWDAKTGRTKLAFRGNRGSVHSVSWSPDGSQIVHSSADQTLRIWDTKTGQIALTLRGPTELANSVAWSPDGSQIVSGSEEDNTIRIWDIKTGQIQLTLQGHTSAVGSVCWSPDGGQVVSGSEDCTLRIWDTKRGQAQRLRKGEGQAIAWSPDGSQIVSSKEDNILEIWDVQSGRVQALLKGHTNRIASLSWSPDGRRIASSSYDHTLVIWDAQTGRAIHSLYEINWANSVSWSPDSSRIVSGGEDNKLRIWDTKTGQLQSTLQGHLDKVNSVSWSPKGDQIASGSNDQTLRIWDALTGQQKFTLGADNTWVTSVAWSPDNSQVVSGYGEASRRPGKIRVWDGKTGKPRLVLQGHTDRVLSVCWSADGSQIASGSEDKTIRIWDAKTGQSKVTLSGNKQGVLSVSWSPDGSNIVSGSFDKTIRIWDGNSRNTPLPLQGHTSSINSMSWSPDGSQVVTASNDKTIRIWVAKTGQTKFLLQGPDESVGALWSADGSQIVSKGASGNTLVWDAKSGNLLPNAPLPDTYEGSLLDPQGKRLLIGSEKVAWIVDLEITQNEILQRKWQTRLDPDWHQEQLQQAQKDQNFIGIAHHRYWYHRAKAEAALDTNRFDEAFAWQVGAETFKTKWTERAELSSATEDPILVARNSFFRGERQLQQGEFVKGLNELSKAIELAPDNTFYRYTRGLQLLKWKLIPDAEADFKGVLQLYDQRFRSHPEEGSNRINLAWFLAVCPSEKIRDGKRAVELATIACEKSKWQNASELEILAAAYAESGNFEEATKWQQKALDIPEGFNSESRLEAIGRLKLYRAKKPYRDE